MINFSLKCAQNHQFEAWFKSNKDFETQQEQKLISCPFCGSTEISKGLMTPAIKKEKAPPHSSPRRASRRGFVARNPAMGAPYQKY